MKIKWFFTDAQVLHNYLKELYHSHILIMVLILKLAYKNNTKNQYLHYCIKL